MLARRPLPRLNVILRSQPKRPQRCKAITIGVGFPCLDGVVLCADTQITFPQSHKYYESKLYPHRTSEWTMVNTFAGDPTLVKSFNGKFENAMALMPPPYTSAKIQDVIETVLSFFDVLDNDPSNLWMLCALVDPSSGDMRLVKTCGKVVTEISGYDYVGVGDSSVLRYLGPLLTEIQGQQYVVDQALRLGTYLVLKAKTYVEDCGGDTEAVIVRPNGHIEIRNGETYRIEQQMLWLEREIKTVSSCFFDPRISDDNFEKVLSTLVQKLTADHSQMHNRPPWKS